MTPRLDPPGRVDPPVRAGEAETLLAFLDYHRDTLRLKVAGLDRDQLGRTLAPSTMSLGGLVRHLSVVEDWWFSVVLAGNPYAPPFDTVDWEADPDWEWHTGATQAPEDLLAELDDIVRHSDAHIAAALERDGLDALSVKESRRGVGRFSLRWILLHMLEEYARHNGHADLIREAIDGLAGHDPP